MPVMEAEAEVAHVLRDPFDLKRVVPDGLRCNGLMNVGLDPRRRKERLSQSDKKLGDPDRLERGNLHEPRPLDHTR